MTTFSTGGVGVDVGVEVEVAVEVTVAVGATTVNTAPFTGAPVTWMALAEVNPCPVKAPALARLAV